MHAATKLTIHITTTPPLTRPQPLTHYSHTYPLTYILSHIPPQMLIVTDSTRRVRCSAIRLLERILQLDVINDLTLSSHRASPAAVSGLGSLSPMGANATQLSAPHTSTGPGSSSGSSLPTPIAAGISAATASLFTKQPSGSNLANGSSSGASPSSSMHQQQGSMSFESTLPVVRVSDCPSLSLSEHAPFRERLTLYFLRIIGACWSPALAATGLAHDSHAMGGLGLGSGGASSESSAGGGGNMTPNNTSNNNNAADGGLGRLLGMGMGMMGGGMGIEGTELGNKHSSLITQAISTPLLEHTF